MSTGIDYSKWDKMVADMSSSDNENHDEGFIPNNNDLYDESLSSKHANVTKLKQPSSVTIGPKGAVIHPTQTQNKANTPSLHQNGVTLSSLLNKWTHNGGLHRFEYLWSQTPDELMIRFLVPIRTKAKHITIGFNAENKQFKYNIKTEGNEWSLNKTFSRKLKESTEEEAKLDWELCNIEAFEVNNKTLKQTMKDILCLADDNDKEDDFIIEYLHRLSEHRFLKVLLEKERISNKVIEWWDYVFINDTKIDLKQRIKDRKTDANKMNDIWNKAHQQFKEKVAKIEPTEIYVDDDDEEPQT